MLAEKQLEYEAILIDLDDRPAWIYEKNVTGRVPVLEEDTLVLSESAVINEYLDERYPQPSLLPADPAQMIQCCGQVIWVPVHLVLIEPALKLVLRLESLVTAHSFRSIGA